VLADHLLQCLRRPVLMEINLEALGVLDLAKDAANLGEYGSRSGF
jgi:hypothetical protein